MPHDPLVDGESEALEEADLLGPGLIHEMRHPLMGIKAGLELIARRLGAGVTALDEWEMVGTQVARLEELFRSYQQLFGPQEVPSGRFALEPVIQRAVDLLAWRLRRLGPRFEWPRGEVHYALGTPTAVLHAVLNLLVNAADAVEEAGGSGRIAVRVLGAPLQIRVSDEGTGIAPEHAARLFKPRFTTKAEGKGTGLGLHIARKAMRRSGGTVRIVEQNDPARVPWARTEFSVDLTSAE